MNDHKTAALVQLMAAVHAYGYAYTAVTPLTHARVNARPGNAWAQDLTGIFGWSRPFHDKVLPAGLFPLMQRAEIVDTHEDGWRSRVRMSTLGDLLFMHSAYPTEAPDAVFFGPDTYRFAHAIEQALASSSTPIRRVADIGCGAGPGAMLVARARPEAEVVALDINHQALMLARVNAVAAGAANVSCRYSDLLNDVDGEFDLIVANPPYLVDPAERAYRHGGGPLGAALALAIIDTALQRLTPGGTLLLYTGVAIVHGCDPFLQAAQQRLHAAGVSWSYRETDPDIFGEELLTAYYAETDRIAAVVLSVRQSV